jgi:hypothetical protein
MTRAIGAFLICFAIGCRQAEVGSAEPVVSPTETAATSGTQQPVGFFMRHVRMHAAPDVVLDIDHLRGRLIPQGRKLPVFDDLTSFYISVDHAQLSMDADSMTALVRRVFDYKGSPLSDVSVSIREGHVEQKGKLRKGIPIPFSVVADVSTERGLIRLRPAKMNVVGVPAGRIMRFVGLELDDVIKVRTGRGVTVRENDLLLEAGHLLPAPEVRGPVTSARIEANRMVIVMAAGPGGWEEPRVSASNAHNYIWFKGGEIRFGRLTMSNADLQLIDADERDPFDFYSARYNDQLVAGYSRNTPDGALRTTMPDYADLRKGALLR